MSSKSLLKLLIDCTDENGNMDYSKIQSSYHGSKDLISSLHDLQRSGYINILYDEDDIGEIEINPSAYRLFNK
jgi:hypothetical protein